MISGLELGPKVVKNIPEVITEFVSSSQCKVESVYEDIYARDIEGGNDEEQEATNAKGFI